MYTSWTNWFSLSLVLFKIFDFDKDDDLSRDDIKKGIQLICGTSTFLSSYQVDNIAHQVIMEADSNKTGTIDFEGLFFSSIQ